MYWKLNICLVWKFFPIFCRYLCEMFGVVLLVTFIMPMIYPLFIAVVVVSYLCVYLSCWVETYAYSWINIYRGWTNNGSTWQCRNKTVCVGCTERTLVVSFVCMKVPLRFSKMTDCWCAFGWSICKQNRHFIWCIQSSSVQGYDDIHKSWVDIII